MKKVIIGIIAMLILIALVISNKKPEKTNGKPVVKIGVIIPLTGNTSQWGIAFKKGIDLALKETNLSEKYEYEVIIEDNAMDNKKTKAIINKLLMVDDVDVVLSTFSPPIQVINETIKDKDILFLGAKWNVTMSNNDNYFNYWFDLQNAVKKIEKFSINKGYNNIAVFCLNQTAYLKGEELLRGTSLNFIDTQFFNFGEKDFRTMINKVKDEEPDAYLILSFDPEYSIIIKQMQEEGINIENIDIIGIGTTEDVNIETINSIANGYFIDRKSVSNSFFDKYMSTYNEEPKYGAPFGYDMFKFVKDAYEKIGTKDLIKIRDFFNTSELSSAYGTVKVHGEENISIPIRLVHSKNGKIEIIEE